MNKGFVTIGISITILIATLAAAGTGFGIYKVRELVKENQIMSEKLSESTDSSQTFKETTVSSSTEDVETDVGHEKENSTVTSTEKVVAVPSRSHIRPAVDVVVKSQPTVNLTPAVASATAEQALKIFNVKASTINDSTDVHWETNIKSDSRLVLDDNFFVSNNHDSKEHVVTFKNLNKSTDFNYEIIASAGSNEVNYFGKFSTPREFVVSFADSENVGCFLVVVEDTAGNPLVKHELRIDGIGKSVMFKPVIENTNLSGELEYCRLAIKLTVTDPLTGEVLFKDNI